MEIYSLPEEEGDEWRAAIRVGADVVWQGQFLYALRSDAEKAGNHTIVAGLGVLFRDHEQPGSGGRQG